MFWRLLAMGYLAAWAADQGRTKRRDRSPALAFRTGRHPASGGKKEALVPGGPRIRNHRKEDRRGRAGAVHPTGGAGRSRDHERCPTASEHLYPDGRGPKER